MLIPFEAFSGAFELDAREELILLAAACQHLSPALWEQLMALQGGDEGGLTVRLLSRLLLPTDALLSVLAPLEPSATLVASGLIAVSPSPGGAANASGRRVHCAHYLAQALLGRTVVDETIAGFCELGQPSLSLADVALDDSARARLNDLARAFQRRGGPPELSARPWTVLLAGPSGTGKSVLAQALGGIFGRTVLRLDCLVLTTPRAELLRTAFGNAQLLGAVLHLDHPDALLAHFPAFGGLLARLVDSFRGLILLEVAAAEGLPRAVLDRVRFRIALTFPGPAQRLELWEAALPASTPAAGDLDLAALANRFQLSGRAIQAAVDWALQLAQTRGAEGIGQADLEAGARLLDPG